MVSRNARDVDKLVSRYKNGFPEAQTKKDQKHGEERENWQLDDSWDATTT